MESEESITLAEPAIYSKGQNKFEVLWKTFEASSFCRYGCPAIAMQTAADCSNVRNS
jgi:hypothetical protein